MNGYYKKVCANLQVEGLCQLQKNEPDLKYTPVPESNKAKVKCPDCGKEITIKISIPIYK